MYNIIYVAKLNFLEVTNILITIFFKNKILWMKKHFSFLGDFFSI